jgi:hypothetical protein
MSMLAIVVGRERMTAWSEVMAERPSYTVLLGSFQSRIRQILASETGGRQTH